MANVGYAALQVFPSMRGIGGLIQRQLTSELGSVATRVGRDMGSSMGAGVYRGTDGRLRSLRGRFVAEGQASGEAFGESASEAAASPLRDGLVVAAVAAGAAMVAGLTRAIENGNITATLQAQLGSSGKVAEKQGDVAGDLYAKGISTNFQQAADAIKATVQSGLAPPGATTKQLERISSKALDVANTFGQDLGGVTSAVSQMMRTGLAKNSAQAFDLITKGFQSGADKAGDLLDTINEYGTQFRKAGLDGATSIGLLNQAIRAGARDSDVAADAIKEFSIRAVDGSETTAAGFKMLGLSSDYMAMKFGKGGKFAAGALDTTLDRLRDIEDPVKRSRAAVALFGTQAEDLGDALFAMDPSKAAKGLGKVGGAAAKMGKTLRSGPGHEIEVFTRKIETGFVNFLGGTVLPVISDLAHWLNANLGPAVRGVVDWFQKWGAYLTPLAVLIGGVTLALVTQRVALKVAAAVTRGFAAAQALLNAVMALNPVVLIVIALAALAAALIVAWKKSDTFRKIVMAAWNGIKTAALFAWNNVLKPALSGIWKAMKFVGSVAMWLWKNVLQPAFKGIWTAAKILFTILVILVLGPIILAFKALAAIGKWLWKNALQPAFRGIAKVAKWLWKNALQPVWNAIKAGLRVIGDVFRWLYRNVVKPVFQGVKKVISFYWNLIKKIFHTAVRFLRNTVGAAFRWLYDKVIKPVWNGIKKTISWAWKNGIRPAFDAVKKAVDKVGEAFKKAKDFIGDQWSKLKNIARKPIEFIINTVYNKGIVGVWNKVAGAFGAPKLKKFRGFARGGILPGQSSWRQGDDQLVPMRRGEGVYVSEAMRDPYERARLHAVNQAAMRGQPLSPFQGGFAKGGIFDWVGKSLQGVGSAAWDTVKRGASWLKDTLAGSVRAGMANAVDPLLSRIPGSSTLFGEAVRRIPRKIIGSIFGYSEAADKKRAAAGIGGAGTRAALRWARAQAGEPYVWGGTGPFGWDCSGFMGGIQSKIVGDSPYRRLWSTFAFSGSRAPAGWVRGMRAPYMIGITNRGVGHTAGTLNGVPVESRGGDGVVVGSGARSHRASLFYDWYGYAPSRKYDSGGVLPPGYSTVYNGTRRPEMVLTNSQWQTIHRAARGAAPSLDGQRLRLVVGDREFDAYVDARADGRVSANSRRMETAARAGRRS